MLTLVVAYRQLATGNQATFRAEKQTTVPREERPTAHVTVQLERNGGIAILNIPGFD